MLLGAQPFFNAVLISFNPGIEKGGSRPGSATLPSNANPYAQEAAADFDIYRAFSLVLATLVYCKKKLDWIKSVKGRLVKSWDVPLLDFIYANDLSSETSQPDKSL